MNRVVIAALTGTLVGLGLGWGLFGAPAGQPAGEPVGGRGAPASTAADPSAGPTPAPIVPRGRGDARQAGARAAPEPTDSRARTDLEARDRTIASLASRLEEATRRANAAEAAREGPRYDAPTAAGRRAQAAARGNLLVEFPDWQERLTLRDGVAGEHGLGPAEQQALEGLYATANARLREALRAIYADLVGDPQAGSASTLNALLHDVMSLAPQEACNRRLPALLQALAEGLPPPATGPDPLPCEAAVRLVFEAVDALDAAVVEATGDAGRAALWSGSSTFEFGTRREP